MNLDSRGRRMVTSYNAQNSHCQSLCTQNKLNGQIVSHSVRVAAEQIKMQTATCKLEKLKITTNIMYTSNAAAATQRINGRLKLIINSTAAIAAVTKQHQMHQNLYRLDSQHTLTAHQSLTNDQVCINYSILIHNSNQMGDF